MFDQCLTGDADFGPKLNQRTLSVSCQPENLLYQMKYQKVKFYLPRGQVDIRFITTTKDIVVLQMVFTTNV